MAAALWDRTEGDEMAESGRPGLTSTEYWVLVGLGIVAVVLVGLGISLAMLNAQVRQEVNERQQFINQSAQLGRLHNELVQGLANLSARSGDEALRSVLAKHGISFSVTERNPDASPVDLSATANQPATGQVGKEE